MNVLDRMPQHHAVSPLMVVTGPTETKKTAYRRGMNVDEPLLAWTAER
jgi:hypothetical protein